MPYAGQPFRLYCYIKNYAFFHVGALGEILGGTYIWSGKANGVRYLKLVSSDMTNAECARWLSEKQAES